MTVFIPIDEASPHLPPARPPPFALWQMGFRPFFLLASVFAALSAALWALQTSGWLHVSVLPGPLWHAHEMLFGFTLAVIVGFLFTAGRNWSGQPTPTGRTLAALVLLWLAARVLILTPFGWAAAAANVAFPLAAAVALGIAFAAAPNRRNHFFVGLLLLWAVASLCVHLSLLGVLALPGWVGIQLALDAVLFIMAVMAGRMVPMFTNNAVHGAQAARRPGLERWSLGLLLLLLVADLAQVQGLALAAIATLAAVAHLARWLLWQPWKTLRQPMVWVLHAAYLWIPVHLLLRTAAALDTAPASAAAHALMVGAAGGLIIGMMTRVAQGHTGRQLRADRADQACYALVLSAALVRVFVPLAMPGWTQGAVLLAAALWSGGFALYAWHYRLVLTRARLDGKPG